MGSVRNFFDRHNITLDLNKRQEMLALDKECESLQSQIDVLKSQNTQLRADVEPLKRANERLEQRLKEETAKAVAAKNAHEKLSDVDEEIVRYLANVRRSDCTLDKITRTLNSFEGFPAISRLGVEVAIGKLTAADYVGATRNFRDRNNPMSGTPDETWGFVE